MFSYCLPFPGLLHCLGRRGLASGWAMLLLFPYFPSVAPWQSFTWPIICFIRFDRISSAIEQIEMKPRESLNEIEWLSPRFTQSHSICIQCLFEIGSVRVSQMTGHLHDWTHSDLYEASFSNTSECFSPLPTIDAGRPSIYGVSYPVISRPVKIFAEMLVKPKFWLE